MLTTRSKPKAKEASSPSEGCSQEPPSPSSPESPNQQECPPGASGAECQMNDRARARGSETKPPPATCGASAGPGPRTHLGGRAGGRAAGGDRAEAGARPAVAASRQPPVRAAEKAAGQPGERASELAAWGCGGGRGPRAHSAPGAGERLSGRPRLALAPASPRCRDPRRSGGDSAPPPTRGYAARAADCVESAAAAAAGGGDARSHVSPRPGPGAPVPLALQASPASRAPAARGPSLVARLPPGSPAGLLTSSRAAAVSAGRPGGIGSLRAGGAGRGAACTSGTLEPERAEPGRSGQSRAAGTSLRTALQSRAGRVLLRSEGREHS